MKPDDLLRIYHFGGGGGYRTPAPPVVPTEDSPEMKAAADEAMRREAALARRKKGRLATILTTPWGVAGEPQLTSGTLLAGKAKLGQ